MKGCGIIPFSLCISREFISFLDEKQIEVVKDGMTYGVVKVTYDATIDMIPSLKEEEKHKSMPGS